MALGGGHQRGAVGRTVAKHGECAVATAEASKEQAEMRGSLAAAELY